MGYNIWESCMLFPGFSRSECASWVQAWGTIVAVAGAFAIAYFQAKHQRRIESERQAELMRERCMTAAEVMRNLKNFADTLTTRMEARTPAEILEIAKTFRHGSSLFSALSPMEFPSALASRFAGLQYAVMMIVNRIDVGSDTDELPRVLRQLSSDCETGVARAHQLASRLVAPRKRGANLECDGQNLAAGQVPR